MQGGTDGVKRQPVDSPRGDELPTAGRFVPPFAVRRYSLVGPYRRRARFPSAAEPLARFVSLAERSERSGIVRGYSPSIAQKKQFLNSRRARLNGSRFLFKKWTELAPSIFLWCGPFFYTAEKPEKSLATRRQGAARRFSPRFLPVAPQPGGGRIRWRSSQLAF